MPQTDFFADEQDEEDLVRFILQKGRFVPDLRYDESELVEICSFDEYKRVRLLTGLFYVVCQDTFTSPLQLVQIAAGHYIGKYAIIPKVGGPTIIVSFYSPYHE